MTLTALVLLWSCGPPPAAPPEPEPEPPVSYQPPPPPRTVDEVFSTLYSQTHGGEQRAIAALRKLCEQACAPVLAAAEDRAREPDHRAAVWWALATAEVDAELRAAIAEAGRRALIDPTTEAAWTRRAAGLAVVRVEGGPAFLSEVMRTGETADVRAASACALLSITPREEWNRHPLDKEAVDRMGFCATPWQYGQQVTGPTGG